MHFKAAEPARQPTFASGKPRAATESMRQESGKGEDKKGKKARYKRQGKR